VAGDYRDEIKLYHIVIINLFKNGSEAGWDSFIICRLLWITGVS
jgi:hypothetical protein